MVVSDAHMPLLASAQAPPADIDPPFVKLEDLGANQETYEDYVLLEGIVVDFSPIHSINCPQLPILGP